MGLGDIDAFTAPTAIEYPSLGLAVAIAEFTARREADALALSQQAHWRDGTTWRC